MKKVKCFECLQVLGVPTKFFGKKVSCPNCGRRLLINFDTPTEEVDSESQPPVATVRAALPDAPPPKATMLTGLRAIPTPTALHKENPDTPAVTAPQEESSSALTSKSPAKTVSKPKTTRQKTTDAATATTKSTEPGKQPKQSKQKPVKQPANQSTTARIIRTQELSPQLDAEGELPTLQLKEDRKDVEKSTEKKTSPVLLGMLVCGSLILSGLILVFGDFQPKSNERVMENARQELSRYYSVRSDIALKPFQLRLREAQLAHSRGDRQAEVAALREVMKMFRVEDRNRFVGVTGSPTNDAELEKLLSILLSDGLGE